MLAYYSRYLLYLYYILISTPIGYFIIYNILDKEDKIYYSLTK